VRLYEIIREIRLGINIFKLLINISLYTKLVILAKIANMKWDLHYLESKLLIGSTLVEGSTLSESESKKILSGKTVSGHLISEARELLNYRSAAQWLIAELNKSPYISIDLIVEFHKRLFVGFPGEFGIFKKTQNFTYNSKGDRFNYIKPSKTQESVALFVNDFNDFAKKDKDQAVETGSALYYRFQEIHPFEDGNGRIGRILISFWFYKHHLEFSFFLKDKMDHLQALEKANLGDMKPLILFFKKRLKNVKTQ